MNDENERQLMEELDREVSRTGSLFALIACLAIATGLAVAAAVAMAPPGLIGPNDVGLDVGNTISGQDTDPD